MNQFVARYAERIPGGVIRLNGKLCWIEK